MISKRLITLALALGAFALIAGCSKGDGDKKTDDKKMDHSKMDHSKMDDKKMDDKKMDDKKMDDKMTAARSVAIAVDSSGFNPGTVNAKAGEQLDLVFTRTTEKTCGTEVVIASTGKKYDLPLNEPVAVAFNAEKAGTVGFACGMDMLKGSIVVE